MLKILYAGYPGGSPAISVKFTFECAPQLKIAKAENYQNFYFWELKVVQS